MLALKEMETKAKIWTEKKEDAISVAFISIEFIQTVVWGEKIFIGK